MSGTRVIIALVILSALLSINVMTAKGGIVFQDNFESHTGTSTWVDTNDVDPGAPPIGQSWTIQESDPIQFQVFDSPVTGSAFQASDGTGKFLHMWKESQADNQAWGGISASGQTDITNTGLVVITAKMYNLVGVDGWGGTTGFMAFDSAVDNFGNRAHDISFRPNGSVIIYDGAGTTYPNAYNINAWNDVEVTMNFTANTSTLKINGNTIATHGWEGGNLSKIQNILIDVADSGGVPGRAGWDDITVTSVPEPGLALTSLLGAVGTGLLRRRRRGA